MNQKLNSISFEIDNQKLTTKIKINKLKIRAGNVVGEIRSGNRKYRDEYIVIGAHFDHLGLGGPGLAQENQRMSSFILEQTIMHLEQQGY